MKQLIFAVIGLVFVGVVIWQVKRAAKGENVCGCEQGCSGNCGCKGDKGSEGINHVQEIDHWR